MVDPLFLIAPLLFLSYPASGYEFCSLRYKKIGARREVRGARLSEYLIFQKPEKL